MTDSTQDDLVKRATFALSDMQGRIDAGKLQVFQDCIERIEALTAERDALAAALDHIVDEYSCSPWGPILYAIKKSRATRAAIKETPYD